MTPRVTASTPFEELPELLTLKEYAIWLGRSEKSERNRGLAGMWPPPMADANGFMKPIRFAKETIGRYVRQELPKPKRRRLTPPQFRRRVAA